MTLDVPGTRQAIEQRGDRAGTEAGAARELTRRDIRTQEHMIQDFEVGRVQPKAGRDDLAGHDALRAHLAHRTTDLRYQLAS